MAAMSAMAKTVEGLVERVSRGEQAPNPSQRQPTACKQMRKHKRKVDEEPED